ncbi:STAS domain-containing protein [Saccharothrix sp. NRRL B-16314]|uniref:STAS domain-containing protein n=1 Tax=Saccharothrix sp. NRRL B-16314 TaxID=1463825 RepID=UPI0007C4C5A5|nr:STAS domain-containing protein [Saccharothrix sp. NRRL B-16314]
MDDFADTVALTARDVAVGVAVVGVVGELDMATVPVVEEFVQRRLGDEVGTLVLDLSGVTFLGSTGINLLISLDAACAESGAKLRLVANTQAVLRPLEVTDMTRHFTIVGAVDEAS